MFRVDLSNPTFRERQSPDQLYCAHIIKLVINLSGLRGGLYYLSGLTGTLVVRPHERFVVQTRLFPNKTH